MTKTWIRGDPAPGFRGAMIGRGDNVALDSFGGRAIVQDLGWRLRAMADQGDCWFHDGDGRVARSIGARLHKRLFPLLERALQFWLTRIERFNVVCYDSDEGGFFKPHRDNPTPASRHRQLEQYREMKAKRMTKAGASETTEEAG